jgi:hypothetical protein
MMRPLRLLFGLLASRALAPLVAGIFLLLYIGIAFFTDEALIILIAITKSSVILIALFSLIPLNRGARLLAEVRSYLARSAVMGGKKSSSLNELVDETVEMTTAGSFSELGNRLTTAGYTVRAGENSLSARRGVSAFPARAIFLCATVCLFCGMSLSLGGRASFRAPVIEGDPFPVAEGSGGIVERIVLEKSADSFLAKTLTMVVAPENNSGSRESFGLYPPARYRGSFVYPRYLGIGLAYRFSAPDLQEARESNATLKLYPPGKEDRIEIQGSPYRLMLSMVRPDDGTDPYITGRMVIFFKLLKGDSVVASGTVPRGGEFSGNGYRVAFPDIRRVVITDFIRDQGVFLIWTAGAMFVLAICVWLPIRCLAPRREFLFAAGEGVVRACSRAEGRRRRHAGVFHEALDFLAAGDTRDAANKVAEGR